MNNKDNKNNKDKKNNFARFLSIALGYTYTLTAPVVLMVIIYYLLVKFNILDRNDVLLIVMILVGLISGYWSLFKEINKK